MPYLLRARTWILSVYVLSVRASRREAEGDRLTTESPNLL